MAAPAAAESGTTLAPIFFYRRKMTAVDATFVLHTGQAGASASARRAHGPQNAAWRHGSKTTSMAFSSQIMHAWPSRAALVGALE